MLGMPQGADADAMLQDLADENPVRPVLSSSRQDLGLASRQDVTPVTRVEEVDVDKRQLQTMLEKIIIEQHMKLRDDLRRDLRECCSDMVKKVEAKGIPASTAHSDSTASASMESVAVDQVEAYDLVPGIIMEAAPKQKTPRKSNSSSTPRSNNYVEVEPTSGNGNCRPRSKEDPDSLDARRGSGSKVRASEGSTVASEVEEPPARPVIQKNPKKDVKSDSSARMRSRTRNLAFGNKNLDVNSSNMSLESESSLQGIRRVIASVLCHPAFDLSIGLLIFANSIMLGAVVNYVAEEKTNEIPIAFRTAETAFCMVFVLELIARLYVTGVRTFFLGPDWHWNIFDFVIVGLQFVDEMTAMFNSEAIPQNLSFARVLKLLKMIRVVRVARVARVLLQLRLLVASIVGSMKNLAWTGLLLLLMVYMVGLFLTQIVAEHIIAGVTNPEMEFELSFYYGNVPLSMLSLFQAITSGVDWNDLTRPLTSEISPAFAIMYVVYIAFSTMCLMNVVTGVFVDSVLMRARADREQFLVRNATEILGGVGNGIEMNLEQFLSKVKTPQMQEFFKGIDANANEAARLFSVVDVDESGWIDAEEFLSGCVRLHGPAKALDTAVLVQNVHNLGRAVTKMVEAQGLQDRISIGSTKPLMKGSTGSTDNL